MGPANPQEAAADGDRFDVSFRTFALAGFPLIGQRWQWEHVVKPVLLLEGVAVGSVRLQAFERAAFVRCGPQEPIRLADRRKTDKQLVVLADFAIVEPDPRWRTPSRCSRRSYKLYTRSDPGPAFASKGGCSMIISVINHTNMPDVEVQQAIRAINVQIEQDFYPYWSIGAMLRLEGAIAEDPDLENPAANMRGDAIIYLEDEVGDNKGTFGYHDLHFSGIPFGFVFTEISRQMGEAWQVTLSHEALELIGDAEVNRLIMGPHPDPKEKGRLVFHWYEMCDAVQAESYEIHGVPVSNFVLPLYFTVDGEPGSRNDFLSAKQLDGKRLPSFGVNRGGYIGFYDPVSDKHDTYFADDLARRRAEIKSQAGFARRGIRYKSQVNKPFATGRVPSHRAAVSLVAQSPKRPKRSAKRAKPGKTSRSRAPAASKSKSKAAQSRSGAA